MITRKLLRSSTFRLALVYILLTMGSMVILLGFIYWATAGYMDREIDATIDEEVLGLTEEYQLRGLVGLSGNIEKRISVDSDREAIYLLTDAGYRPIVGNITGWPDTPVDDAGWTDFRLQASAGNDQAESEGAENHGARARALLLHGDLHLLVGRKTRDLEATRRLILGSLGWGLAITVILALGVGLFMSSQVMRRIEVINQTSREIMDGDLSRRIPTVGSDDDFDRLAVNLNRMLERIESLMAAVRQVSDNIAHDLRTPLTRLRTRLEQARGGDEKQIPAVVDRAIDDADELLTTFNALLRIARIESGSSTIEFTGLDLADIMRDIAELYEPVAEQKGQQLQLQDTGSVRIRGDRDLLFQALANLVDNAIKHTPQGSCIKLAASTTGSGVQVQVSDTGPGIVHELHDRVFQRFYRCDASRSTPGSGLGLSLVHAIAELHHARIMLADNEPGLRVTIEFGAS